MTSRLNRIISRQAGRPSGLLGHLIGRIMVKDTARPNEAGLQVLDAHAGETVLELGFGQGRTIGALTRAGVEVIGVEVSETMKRQAAAVHRKSIDEGRVQLLVGDGVALPVGEASVDAVFSAHTVYFWPDPAATFDDIARVLVPGGRVVLVFRDGAFEPPARLDPDVYTFHTVADVEGFAARAGLIEAKTHDSDELEDHVVVWSAHKRSNS